MERDSQSVKRTYTICKIADITGWKGRDEGRDKEILRQQRQGRIDSLFVL